MSLSKLMQKLPLEIIVNNIAPYIYLKQDKYLLNDIRSYYNETRFLENLYYSEFNDSILLYDLLRFCNRGQVHSADINDTFETILRRNSILLKKDKEFLTSYRLRNFVNSMGHNPRRKIKFLWGLLTPIERNVFINRVLFNLEN
jgi:hypothetical protein